MSNADDRRDTEPWHPISNAVDLKTLGKLGEEVNELGSAICRCVIQGVFEHEPVTGKLNSEWLEDEIADVQAGMELTIRRFGLNRDRIQKRADQKRTLLKNWHDKA